MEKFEELEVKWAEWNYLDPKGMVACSSGTSALHLAFEALQLPEGTKVICPDLTMIACPRAIVMAGLEPILVDCNDRLLASGYRYIVKIERNNRIGNAPVVALAVHIYGRKVDIESMVCVATYPGCFLVEDLAEAHGIRPHPQTDVACWSFYKNKIIYGEEGGAVWFKDHNKAKLARQLRSLGFTEEHDFNHIPRGHNYRMSNCHANLILNCLERFDSEFDIRRWSEECYNKSCPSEWKMPQRNSPWVYDFRIPGLASTLQTKIVKTLNHEGIAARHCFKPVSKQEEFKIYASRWSGRTVHDPLAPNEERAVESKADVASREVIYLPLKHNYSSIPQWLADHTFKIIKDSMQGKL